MLRVLFGERPREWAGAELETVRAIESFVRQAYETAERRPAEAKTYRTYAIAAEGLLRSMDELEQSVYAAKRYALFVPHKRVDELTERERLDYDRHVYYDKNAYIRVFALLDKLATLLNPLLGLRTERIKSRYSYYTMLRNMRENDLHPGLSKPLNALKVDHQGAMNRLRHRRNLEIHQMNAELRDDLQQSLADKPHRMLENLKASMADLEQGWEMCRESLHASFRYANGIMRRIR
ncbi:Cthe_2314 family HEPN domain-containing protein [Paenibacillaceae bacterium WGS1546]|uniref:Cthe_2314 family HEPN domain-containing protein n=1 Tax=Cohnella sp. WGS1546 TaxID=3366810 RepID=UPI00372D3681